MPSPASPMKASKELREKVLLEKKLEEINEKLRAVRAEIQSTSPEREKREG